MQGPDPAAKHPAAGFPDVCFIKNTITRPNIIVGDYTYYDDPDHPEDFQRNVLYHYPFVGDKLIIGKFCAVARGVRFLMSGGNHPMAGLSTYPFHIFGGGWERVTPETHARQRKGDTVVGSDVWLGYESLILPGVHIGDGVIVAARSVVVSDVPPYAIVGGNPAKLIRRRFTPEVIDALEEIAWWDWDAEKITRNLEAIVAADVEALRRCV
jgi:virginiamycin A acetyltransferase